MLIAPRTKTGAHGQLPRRYSPVSTPLGGCLGRHCRRCQCSGGKPTQAWHSVRLARPKASIIATQTGKLWHWGYVGIFFRVLMMSRFDVPV